MGTVTMITWKNSKMKKQIYHRWYATFETDTRLSKWKHPRKRFQNFRQSYVVCLLVKFQFHTNGHGSLLANK